MMQPVLFVLLLAAFLQPGCSGISTAPLDMTALDQSQDQEKIAAYYRHEAAVARQQAEELNHRAMVYERLFGPESEWVTGTRLLAQFYEDVAREAEQLAQRHLKISK
jgi:hypothetical protein